MRFMGNASLAKCRTMHCNALHYNAHTELMRYNASSKTCTAIHCAATLYQLNWDVVLMYCTSVMQYTRLHTDVFGSKIAFRLLHYCIMPLGYCSAISTAACLWCKVAYIMFTHACATPLCLFTHHQLRCWELCWFGNYCSLSLFKYHSGKGPH